MAYGENLLKIPSGVTLRDYTHAAQTFLTGNYQYSPRVKFLFHVYFNINTGQIPALQTVFGTGDIYTLGLMVKTAQVPSFSLQVETMNQYNRKRLVQNKINYNPVQIAFHDDQDDLVRTMWYNYFAYYYKDPSQSYAGIPSTNGSLGNLQTLSTGSNYNVRDIYQNTRVNNDWGFIGEAYNDTSSVTGHVTAKPPFFTDIRIYGLSQKTYSSYVLINPLITDWQSDTYDYGQAGATMTNTMTIDYETVKYYEGSIGGSAPSGAVTGFADPMHYDNVPSPIARSGSTFTTPTKTGYTTSISGSAQDLQATATQSTIGGVQQSSVAYQSFASTLGLNNVGLNPQNVYGQTTTGLGSLGQYGTTTTLGTPVVQTMQNTTLPAAVQQVLSSNGGFSFPTPGANT